MTVHRNKLLFNEANRRTRFQIYSCKQLYIIRVVPLPIIRSWLLYICTFGTGICYRDLTTASVQDQDGTAFHADPAR